METNEKIIANLDMPDGEPVPVEITDTDKPSWTAIVAMPGGTELYVSIDRLHDIEYINKDGTRTVLGEPRCTDEDRPDYLVVKAQKEVLA